MQSPVGNAASEMKATRRERKQTLVAQKPSVFPAKERARLRMEPYTARRRVVPSTQRTTCAGVALRNTQ